MSGGIPRNDGSLFQGDRASEQALTKTDHAYQRIRQGILSGHFMPGQPLDQEALARDLGLSTTPVREALRRLESERLLIRRAHRDVIVAPLSVETVEEIYAVRLSLDPLAAQLASVQASAEERALMLETLGDNEGDSPLTLLDRNRAIHRGIYSASGNRLLVELLDTLYDLSDRFRLITLRDLRVQRSAHEEHREIVRSVVEGRPERAARLVHEHTAESLQRVREGVR